MGKVKTVIIVVVDGLKREVFFNLLADRELPGFSEAFGDGLWVRYGTTVFPSETLPSQTSLFTGLQVRRHGIVGNGWLDRDTDPPRMMDFEKAGTAAGVFGYRLFGLPTILLPLSDPVGLINRELCPGARTIYEYAADAGLSSTVIYNHISRGAGMWVRPSRRDIIYYAMSTKGWVDFKRIDRRTWLSARGSLKRDGMPNIFTLYFSGLDAWGHHTKKLGQGHYLKEAIDPLISELLAYLDGTGERDSTVLALCSDHGQAWLGDVEMLPNASLLADLEGAGFRARMHSPPHMQSDSCIFVIGGCMQFYVKNRKNNDWKMPPDLERDLMPLAAALGECCGAGTKQGSRSGALILVRKSLEEGYFVFSKGELLAAEDYFWSRLDKVPSAFENIYGLNCARSGDIVVFSDFEEGYYVSDSGYSRGHGSLALEDMSIPIVFAGGGLKHRVAERASIIDIAPTVLSLFGIRTDGMDGKPLRLEGV